MPRGYARYVLAVMVGINFPNYLDRYILPAVATKIQGEFHLTDSQVGLLGSAFLLVYAVATIPFGIWADRGVRKTVVAVGVTIWSLATLFTGLARNYVQLFAARAVLGIGEASYYPAGTALLGDYFRKEGRARAMSIWAAGTAVGIAVGFAGGGIVASRLGWRTAFYMTAVPGLVFAVLAFGLREPRRGAASNLPVGIAGFLAGAVFVALALVMPSLGLFLPMFLLGAASLYLYNGPYTAIKQNVVLPTVRATAVTIALLIEHLLGDSYAPWAIGRVSDALQSLQLALLILLPPLLVLAALFATLGLRHEDRDGRAMEAHWASAAPIP